MRYLILLILFSSCYTKKAAIQKWCSQDSVKVTIHDTIEIHDTLLIQADTGSFNLDSEQTFVEDDNIEIHVQDTIIRYKIKEKVIPYEKRVPYTKIVNVPCNCPEVCPKTRWERMRDARYFVLISFLFGVGLGLYLKFRRS